MDFKGAIADLNALKSLATEPLLDGLCYFVKETENWHYLDKSGAYDPEDIQSNDLGGYWRYADNPTAQKCYVATSNPSHFMGRSGDLCLVISMGEKYGYANNSNGDVYNFRYSHLLLKRDGEWQSLGVSTLFYRPGEGNLSVNFSNVEEFFEIFSGINGRGQIYCEIKSYLQSAYLYAYSYGSYVNYRPNDNYLDDKF